jgi:D-alanyl-D-alanine carboxypeptidase
MDGCIGLKTGYTKAAGRTLVSCAEKNGQRLVAVTLQDGNDWADHQALYEYGFASYPAQQLTVLGQVVTRAEVSGGVQSTVALVAADSFSWPVAESEDVRMQLDTHLTAPVTAGAYAGQAVFTLDGVEIGRVDLLCGETVVPQVASAMCILKWNG